MSLSQLEECELQCISAVDKLNSEITLSQTDCRRRTVDHLKTVEELRGLGLIIDAFHDVEE